jgi:radical SAM/Cys-rich protein
MKKLRTEQEALQKQFELLDRLPHTIFFDHRLADEKIPEFRTGKIEIFQINVGKKCNLKCVHCHVEAGPTRKEMISPETLAQCFHLIKKHRFATVDLTGGAPELVPHIETFIEKIAPYTQIIIFRSNLVLLILKRFQTLLDTFVKCKVEIICSLPDYHPGRTDRMRGDGVFNNSIKALQLLNKRGYGLPGFGLNVHLVHNPMGAILPGSQATLEADFKRALLTDFGISFNNLYSITNMPINRFLEFLVERNIFDEYMEELVQKFNPQTVKGLMCLNTLSVGWDGQLYDCDFNQMLERPTLGNIRHIDQFDLNALTHRKIFTHNHCYGCTAGGGSSCQGATE